jgi:hypothetical protein
MDVFVAETVFLDSIATGIRFLRGDFTITSDQTIYVNTPDGMHKARPGQHYLIRTQRGVWVVNKDLYEIITGAM